MKVRTETIRELLDEIFEELKLQDYRYNIQEDLVSVSEDTNLNSIEFVKPSDSQLNSWVVRVFKATDMIKPLGAISIPSKSEQHTSDIRDYLKKNIQQIIETK